MGGEGEVGEAGVGCYGMHELQQRSVAVVSALRGRLWCGVARGGWGDGGQGEGEEVGERGQGPGEMMHGCFCEVSVGQCELSEGRGGG